MRTLYDKGRRNNKKFDYDWILQGTVKLNWYAITISATNFGMMIGAVIGGLIFILLALYGANFTLIYFVVAIFCVGVQLLSFWIFMTIDPAEYEFEHHLKK